MEAPALEPQRFAFVWTSVLYADKGRRISKKKCPSMRRWHSSLTFVHDSPVRIPTMRTGKRTSQLSSTCARMRSSRGDTSGAIQVPISFDQLLISQHDILGRQHIVKRSDEIFPIILLILMNCLLGFVGIVHQDLTLTRFSIPHTHLF